MRHMVFMALLGSTALISTAGLAQTADPASGNSCERLVALITQYGSAASTTPLPMSLDQARTYQRDNNQQACREAIPRIEAVTSAQTQQPAQPGAAPAPQQAAQPDAAPAQTAQPGAPAAADGTRIVVQEPAPTIRVEQASPQVTVQQQQPQVTVRQAQPEILVRQPAPTVTVDIPQPEIIVRMPQPDVNVAVADPKVQVNQPQPQVQVVQPQQPEVQVQPGQPNVTVQRAANAEANVQVQSDQGQPQVRYERQEPRVVVNQPPGDPQIRIEQQGQANQQTAAVTPPPAAAPAAPPPAGPAARPAPADSTGAVSPASPSGAGTQAVPVSRIADMNVVDVQGRTLGEIERVVQGPDGRMQVVVGVGGFLGLGERDIALPLDELALRNNELVIRQVNEQELRAMPAFNNQGVRPITGDQTAQVRTFQ